MSCRGGYLCVFNFEHERDGAAIDRENLKRTFESMGAEVDIFIDLDYTAIKKELSILKAKDFSQYLFVAVAFLGHGGNDGFVQVGKGPEILIVQIEKDILIRLSRNPTLSGKLKWLVMQSCQGNYDFMKDQAEGQAGSKPIPEPSYILRFYATSPGTKAYRNAEIGSIFIHYLCEHLQNDFRTKHLEEIFNDVGVDTKRYFENHGIVQKPTCRSELGETKFYVTTGLRDT